MTRCALLLPGDYAAFHGHREEFFAARPLLSRSRYATKAELLTQFFLHDGRPIDERTEAGLDEHNLALQRLLQGRFEEMRKQYALAERLGRILGIESRIRIDETRRLDETGYSFRLWKQDIREAARWAKSWTIACA